MGSRRWGAAACLAAAWLGLGSVAGAAEPPAEESGPSFGSPEDRALWRELKTATSEAVLHLARISQCAFRIRYARHYQELEARASDAAVGAEAKALRARLEQAAAGAQSAVPPDGGRVHACRYALLHLEQAMEFPDDPGMRDDVPRRRDEARQCAARMGALLAAVRPRADALEAALADVDALLARTPRPATAPAAGSGGEGSVRGGAVKRPALVAAALVAVALGVLAVRGFSRDAAPPRAPAAPVPVAAAPPSPPVQASPAPAVGPAGTPTPVTAAAPQPWSAVRVAGRLSELGPAARFLNDGLSDARRQMEPCFEDEVRRLETAPPPEIDPNDPPRGPAALMLHVESREDELVVVDAELDYLGTSTLELVACCRERLAGWRMPSQGIPSGQRWRLKYLLQ